MEGISETVLSKKMKLVDHVTHLEIIYRWFNAGHFLIAVFAAFWWFGFITFLRYPPENPPDITSSLLILALGVFLTYLSVVGFFNRTYITASPTGISIRHRPIPFKLNGNVDIDASNLKRLYSKGAGVHTGKGGSVTLYAVHALTNDGNDKPILWGLESEEQALYIEQKIEKYLRIKNVPVEAPLEATVALQNTDTTISHQPSGTQPQVFPEKFRLPAVFVGLFFIFGVLLETGEGEYFVFSAADQYRAALPWLFAFLLPSVGWLLFHLERVNHATIISRYPTWWMRWLVIYPILVTTCSAFITFAPLGWFALHGKLLGSPLKEVNAEVLDVYYPSSRRGCQIKGHIRINNSSANVCLSRIESGRAPVAGETIVISGRISSLGVYIEQIRVKCDVQPVHRLGRSTMP